MDYTTLTLAQLMAHQSQRVRRQAIAIFKMLPEETARIGREYVQDAMTRKLTIDERIARANIEDKTYNFYCPCSNHKTHWTYDDFISRGQPVCPNCDADMKPIRHDI